MLSMQLARPKVAQPKPGAFRIMIIDIFHLARAPDGPVRKPGKYKLF